MKSNMKSYPIGISIPRSIVKKIDATRRDIPRSKFILRLIENGLSGMAGDEPYEEVQMRS